MFKSSEKNGTLVFTFPERIDTEKSLKMESSIIDCVLRNKMPVVFDMKGVKYICSAFLRICVKSAQSSKPHKLAMVHSDKFVIDALRMTGLDKIVQISEEKNKKMPLNILSESSQIKEFSANFAENLKKGEKTAVPESEFLDKIFKGFISEDIEFENIISELESEILSRLRKNLKIIQSELAQDG